MDLTDRQDRPLAATSSGNTTFYLYGQGRAIAELTAAWTYYLADGTGTPRQLTDVAGNVTLSRRYTPWGEVLEQTGAGNFTWGYFGGLMDAATGLLYVGNGQYYDPATGRFLTPVHRNSPNPYVPWQVDPIGAMLGPISLLVLWRRKRKPGKFDTLIVLVVLVTGVSVGLAACQPSGGVTAASAATTAAQPPTMPLQAANTQAPPPPPAAPTTTPTSAGSSTDRPALTAPMIAAILSARMLCAAEALISDPRSYSLPEWFSRIAGGFSQYFDDTTFGGSTWLITRVLNVNGDMDSMDNAAFQEGRLYGRAVSYAQATVETGLGLALVMTSVSILPPTAAGTAGCAAVTAGGCLVVGGSVIVVEGAAAAAGVVSAVHGGMVLANNSANPVTKLVGDGGGGRWGTGSSATRTINGIQVRVDWESPGQNGNVHVTLGDRKIYITDPNDLSDLPKGIRNDTWVQRQIQHMFDQLNSFERR